MGSYKTAAQRSKPHGKKTEKKMVRNQPTMVRG
jgi:hypothetical protein